MNKSIDKHNLRKFLLDFPNQFKKALEFSKDIKVSGEFDNLIITGIGGSTLPGDLVKALVDLKIPVIVNKDYDLPKEASKKSLIFVSSYSGNTEEALSAYEEAKKKGLKMVGFCSGGKLEELCKKDKVPLVRYPDEAPVFQPRWALGYTFTAMATVLDNSGLTKNVSRDVLDLSEFLEKNKKRLEKESISIAKRLEGKIPVIYASERLRSLAYTWKINFNENSKTSAFYNCFPELNHNEITGYTKPQGRLYVIILRDKEDHPRIIKRMRLTKDIIKSYSGEAEILDLEGKNTLAKVFSSIYLSYFVAYYLAIEYGFDPTPVKLQEDIKKRMRE